MSKKDAGLPTADDVRGILPRDRAQWCPGCSQNVSEPCHHYHCPAKEKFASAQGATEQPIGWVVERPNDPTFPRFFQTEASARDLEQYVTIAPKAVASPMYSGPRSPAECAAQESAPSLRTSQHAELLPKREPAGGGADTLQALELLATDQWCADLSTVSAVAREALDEIRQLRTQVEEAKDIISGLFNFDMGSAERAIKFLDDGLPTHEDVRGILSDTSTMLEPEVKP